MVLASTALKSRARTRISEPELSVETVASLMPVTAEQWRELFAQHPDPPELIKLVDESGMDGFQFHSIVVGHANEPILVIPIMVARYPMATTLDGKAKEIGLWLESKIPNLLSPRVLLIGFVEGEWGQVGISQKADAALLEQAWRLATRAIEVLRRKTNSPAVAFWQFTEEALSQIPQRILDGYGMVASQPFSKLPIDFSSLDEYLSKLDSDMKRYLKRAARNTNRIRIERTKNIDKYADEIFALYKAQVASSEISFGQQTRDYFRNVCKLVPGAEYMLYLEGEKLLGWELLVQQPQQLSSKYFAMYRDAGREYKLYFVSWIENVRYCLANGIKHLHVGASGEDLKTLLGAKLIPTAVVVKFGNPLIQEILCRLEDELAYESKIDIPKVQLAWRNRAQSWNRFLN